MLPVVASKSNAVKDAAPFVEPSAAAFWMPSVPPEPTCTNEPVRGEVAERVEVETPNTPVLPLETRSWLEDGWDVVARPSQVNAPVPEL